MLDSMLAALGLSKGATIGGFLGALVSLKFIEGLTIIQRVGTVLGGCAAASYVTPLVLLWLQLSGKVEGAIAFLIGVFGMSLAAAIMKAIPGIIEDVRSRVRGKQNGG